MPTFNHTWEILDDSDEAVFAVELLIDYTISPIVPAVISAPAERCHPEEGGDCDVEAVRVESLCGRLPPEKLKKNRGERWSSVFPLFHTAARAFAHLFEQAHDVEQLCRDHAEAVHQDHCERSR